MPHQLRWCTCLYTRCFICEIYSWFVYEEQLIDKLTDFDKLTSEPCDVIATLVLE